MQHSLISDTFGRIHTVYARVEHLDFKIKSVVWYSTVKKLMYTVSIFCEKPKANNIIINSACNFFTGKGKGSQTATVSVQHTVVFTAFGIISLGSCRKDLLLCTIYCKKVLQKRCMSNVSCFVKSFGSQHHYVLVVYVLV